jgi:hypothetical protein
MKKLLTLSFLLIISINLFAQNVGINNTNPQASLDVQGDLRLRSTTLTLPAGLNNDVDLITQKSSVYMFAGGALGGAVITGFTGGIDGRIITIFNNSTTASVQLNDASFSVSPSAAANKILTGNGNNAVIYTNGSITLRYDGAKAKWIVMGSNYTDGLSTVTAGSGPWSITGNDIKNTNTGNIGIGVGALTPVNKIQIGNPPGFFGNDIAIGNGTQGMSLYQSPTASVFYTNTNFAMMPASGVGNVGIGTTSPYRKLQVEGDALINHEPLVFVPADPGPFGGPAYFTGGVLNIANNVGTKRMVIDGSQIQSLASFTGLTNALTLNPYGGNVGVRTGTTVLQNKFQIGNAPGFFGNDIAVGNGTQAMSFSQGTTASIWYTNTNFALMPASGTGNVGIGTTTPAEKLSVNGNIRSKEVVVELANWPDYVFDKKYNLPSLKNVEAYINEHKHLPNIPSAKEIETDGLKLGDVQKRMMQKIEELTLYIIEQNKRIDALEKKLSL